MSRGSSKKSVSLFLVTAVLLLSQSCTQPVEPHPPLSSETRLAALEASTGEFIPSFSEDVNTYDLRIAGAVEAVIITGTPRHTGALVSAPSGVSTATPMGETVIKLTVTAPSGRTREYTVTVKRPFLRTISFLKGSENASGTMEPVRVYEGESLTLPENGFVYEGRNFQGWALPGATQVQWQDGDAITAGADDQTLTALWDLDQNNTVYVATSGNDANAGTSLAPVRTLEKGLQIAWVKGAGTRVHAASGGYSGPVLTLPDGIQLIGGWDPATWVRTQTQSTVYTASAQNGEYMGMKVLSVTQPSRIESLEIRAPSAGADSASSYGLYVKDSSSLLTVKNVVLRAGNGAAGQNGSAGTNGNSGVVGAAGFQGRPDDDSVTVPGGAGGSGAVAGGRGGNGGNVASAYRGQNGTSVSNAGRTSAAGAGGLGGDPGRTGTAGSNGLAGANGAGGDHAGTSGSVTGDFWAASTGLPGADGQSGMGGGGGGGGGGQDGNFVTIDGTGNGGGGGGGGGYPGTAGTAGRSGGGSFGIFVVNCSGLVLENVTVYTGSGGQGGSGGAGGLGGNGGAAGQGASVSTSEIGRGGNGGSGGKGGNGGSGGSGAGGPSVAVYLHNSTVDTSRTALYPGTGGTPGAGNTLAGISAAVFE